jgi:hypothetical protein
LISPAIDTHEPILADEVTERERLTQSVSERETDEPTTNFEPTDRDVLTEASERAWNEEPTVQELEMEPLPHIFMDSQRLVFPETFKQEAIDITDPAIIRDTMLNVPPKALDRWVETVWKAPKAAVEIVPDVKKSPHADTKLPA